MSKLLPKFRLSVKYIFAFIYAVVFLMPFFAYAQDPNFHIYIALGQSNMDGAGDIESQDKQGVDSRFQVLYGVNCPQANKSVGNWYKADPPICRCNSGLSPMDYFGREMLNNVPNDIKIGVISVAVGGAKIELFNKRTYESYINNEAPDWMLNWINEYQGNPYQRIIELAQIAKQDGIIKGIMLHQGESNTGDQQWPQKVKEIYDDLINDLDLDPAQTPLVAGEVVTSAMGGACGSMNGIIARLPSVIPNSHVVSAQDLEHKGDGLHFTSAAYRELGKRYAQKMLSVVNLEPPIIVPTPRDSVFNGDFSQKSAGWTLNVWGGEAHGLVKNEEYFVDIQSSGEQNYHIQLIQNGIRLSQHQYYEVSFDAYATQSRSLELNIEQDDSPWQSYFDSPVFFDIDNTIKNYQHRFSMEHKTDENSRLSFNMGLDTPGIYIDNVKIIAIEAPTILIKAPVKSYNLEKLFVNPKGVISTTNDHPFLQQLINK